MVFFLAPCVSIDVYYIEVVARVYVPIFYARLRAVVDLGLTTFGAQLYWHLFFQLVDF